MVLQTGEDGWVVFVVVVSSVNNTSFLASFLFAVRDGNPETMPSFSKAFFSVPSSHDFKKHTSDRPGTSRISPKVQAPHSSSSSHKLQHASLLLVPSLVR